MSERNLNIMSDTVSRQEERLAEVEKVFKRYQEFGEKGRLLDKLNPVKNYQQLKALNDLQKAHEAAGLDDVYGGDYAVSLGMAKDRMRASGIEFPEERVTLSDQEYANKESEIKALRAEMEGKYFAQDALMSERSGLSKINPKHMLASAKVVKGFDELNQMLKGSVESVNIYDAKMMLSIIDENIEKAGVDMEAYNAQLENNLNEALEQEASMEGSNGIEKGAEKGDLTPLEVYKEEVQAEFDVLDANEVRGVYRVKVRQSLAEQTQLDEGHQEMVDHPEIGLEDKVNVLTEVAAGKVGLDLPEHSNSDNLMERTTAYSMAMEEKLKTCEGKLDKGPSMEMEDHTLSR
ncbi:MAG: hypothetical protein CMF61_08170 [Magnetococcales bacterium]|mgnify:CR=1 FL=1|nr:hypothetical protein [Magnetococcales bacterium]